MMKYSIERCVLQWLRSCLMDLIVKTEGGSYLGWTLVLICSLPLEKNAQCNLKHGNRHRILGYHGVKEDCVQGRCKNVQIAMPIC